MCTDVRGSNQFWRSAWAAKVNPFAPFPLWTCASVTTDNWNVCKQHSKCRTCWSPELVWPSYSWTHTRIYQAKVTIIMSWKLTSMHFAWCNSFVSHKERAHLWPIADHDNCHFELIDPRRVNTVLSVHRRQIDHDSTSNSIARSWNILVNKTPSARRAAPSVRRHDASHRYERVNTRCKNSSCEITQWLFETFGWERVVWLNRNLFAVGELTSATYERLCDGSVVEFVLLHTGRVVCAALSGGCSESCLWGSNHVQNSHVNATEWGVANKFSVHKRGAKSRVCRRLFQNVFDVHGWWSVLFCSTDWK